MGRGSSKAGGGAVGVSAPKKRTYYDALLDEINVRGAEPGSLKLDHIVHSSSAFIGDTDFRYETWNATMDMLKENRANERAKNPTKFRGYSIDDLNVDTARIVTVPDKNGMAKVSISYSYNQKKEGKIKPTRQHGYADFSIKVIDVTKGPS